MRSAQFSKLPLYPLYTCDLNRAWRMASTLRVSTHGKKLTITSGGLDRVWWEWVTKWDRTPCQVKMPLATKKDRCHPHFFQLQRIPPCQKNVSAVSTQWAASNFERMAFNGAVLDLCNRAVSEKTHTFLDLRCLLSTWQNFRTNRVSRGEMWLNRQTDRHTDTTKYRNPCCACTPRVNIVTC